MRCDVISEMETVGRPINVEKCEQPSAEQIKHVQKLYIEELYRCVVFAAERL